MNNGGYSSEMNLGAHMGPELVIASEYSHESTKSTGWLGEGM